MAEPFIGEIRMISFTFPPKGWAFCNGQLLPINQNQALFALLGTYYGGDGRVNFALPDLRARVPIHFNGLFPLGLRTGETAHTLTIPELPAHTHVPAGSSTPANQGSPVGNLWASENSNAYSAGFDSVMSPQAVSYVGGSQPHENMPPYLVINFCIALVGVFPSVT